MSASATVSTSDRLSFTIFVAAVFHVILVFGVVFTAPKLKLPQVMEVTLAQHRSKDADKDADFLADANQRGSGVLDKAALVTSPHQSRFHADEINEIQPEEKLAASRASSAQSRQVISTTAKSNMQFNSRKAEQERQEQMEARQAQLATAWQSDEIASLEARLAAKKQAYAKRPRVRTVSTISTKYDRDAAYVDAFRSRVEEIGNKNYPTLARQKKITGTVRLMVSILATGQVKEIIVLKSSGYPVLDEAARQSVRLAEPFQPFPAAIRQDTDILQIIRTWKFSDRLSSES
ncbi:MAG: TonB family protein [Pedobacter sp.]|nr:TonB family protein [Pedobacter sp.]